MTKGAGTWYGRVNETGSYSVLARITSLQGSGEEIAPGEGNLLKRADVSSISLHIFDLGSDRDATSGNEILPAPTVAVSTSIYDSLQTLGWASSPNTDGGGDPYGYNFRHDLSSDYVPEGGAWFLLEYRFNLSGVDGGVIWLRTKVKSVNLLSGGSNPPWINPTLFVSSWNARTGNVLLTSADVTAALGFTDFARTSQTNTFTQGTNVFQTGLPTSVPVAVQAATLQTANLQEWRNSGGTALAYVSAAGRLSTSLNGQNFGWQVTVGRGVYAVELYGPTGIVAGFANGGLTIGANTTTTSPPANGLYVGGGVIVSGFGANVAGFVLRGNASQTANLHEWQKSDTTVYATVSENGYFTTRKIAAPADAELSPSEAAYWLDDTPGNTKFCIKAKDSGGTVRTATINLT